MKKRTYNRRALEIELAVATMDMISADKRFNKWLKNGGTDSTDGMVGVYNMVIETAKRAVDIEIELMKKHNLPYVVGLYETSEALSEAFVKALVTHEHSFNVRTIVEKGLSELIKLELRANRFETPASKPTEAK